MTVSPAAEVALAVPVAVDNGTPVGDGRVKDSVLTVSDDAAGTLDTTAAVDVTGTDAVGLGKLPVGTEPVGMPVGTTPEGVVTATVDGVAMTLSVGLDETGTGTSDVLIGTGGEMMLSTGGVLLSTGGIVTGGVLVSAGTVPDKVGDSIDVVILTVAGVEAGRILPNKELKTLKTSEEVVSGDLGTSIVVSVLGSVVGVAIPKVPVLIGGSPVRVALDGRSDGTVP